MIAQSTPVSVGFLVFACEKLKRAHGNRILDHQSFNQFLECLGRAEEIWRYQFRNPDAGSPIPSDRRKENSDDSGH